MPTVSKFQIRSFELFTPTIHFDSDDKPRIDKTTLDEYPISHFYHFSVVVDEKGVPWAPACLYLLSKLGSINTPNTKTLESIANDLVTFRRFLIQENIQYDFFPKRKLNRPTYRYRAYLVFKVRDGSISANTAKRKISSVVGFYRWLQNNSFFNAVKWSSKTGHLVRGF